MKKILLTLILSMCIGTTAAIGAEENSAPEAAENTDIIQEIEASATPIVTSEPTAAPKPTSTPVVTLQPYKDPPPYDKSFLHETHDGFYMLYSVASDGSAVFEGVDAELSKNYPSKLVIPEKLGGHTVKTVKRILPYEPGWPQIHRTDVWKTVTEIELPDTVETIENSAFNYLEHLEHINLPTNLKVLGDYIKSYNNKKYDFDELVLPSGLKRIKNYTFSGAKIDKIVLPDGLQEIGECAFYGSYITEMYIPDSVTKVGKQAFWRCERLKKMRISKSMKNDAGLKDVFDTFNSIKFEYDGELTETMIRSLLYSDYIKNYIGEHEENGMLIEDGVLVLYGGKEKNVSVPEGVKEIGQWAFSGSGIVNVSFPSTLKTISRNAFAASKIRELYIPASVTTIAYAAFLECDDLERIEFEDKGQKVSVADIAFTSNYENLQVVILPENFNASTWACADEFWDVAEKSKNAPRSTAKPVDTKNEEKATAVPETTPQPEKACKFVVTNEDGEIGISLNGEIIPFRTDKPFIDESGRTQTPLRAVMEYFGCNVSYDDKTRTVEASKLGTVVKLTVDSPDMTVNGETVKMDTTAQIINDRTYIPLRYLSEALGYEVEFVADNNAGEDSAESIDFDENGNIILPEGWLTEAEMQEKYGLEVVTETGRN